MNNKSNYKYLLSELNKLKGVGVKTKNLLKKKNVNNIFDLLWKLPKSYIDRSLSSKIKDLRIGENQTINIIPHTWNNTSLKKLKVGDLLNTEIDMLARYVFKAIENLKQ